MPRESKKKTPKKKTKEKSTKESETPSMDEDEINRLMQNAFDQANARAEQRFEERLTALREEFNQKHHGGYVGQPAGTFSPVRVFPDFPTGEDITWYQENDVVAA